MKNVNWGIVGILILTIVIWYGILCWSAWGTLTALVVIAAICGIIMRLKENRY